MRLSSRDTSPEMAIKKVRALTDQVPNLIHLYITRQAIAKFNSRALAGEFAGKVANPSKYRKQSVESGDVALAA